MMDQDRKQPSALSQLLSVLLLPFNVTVIIPAIILYFSAFYPFTVFHFPFNLILFIIGGGILIIGLVIAIAAIRQFIHRGKGTLAPWDPPRKLVVSGVYRYTRNPMISGVAFILLGEGILFGSWVLLSWFILFSTVNYIYFIIGEEPQLEKKFGADYREYKKHVPRLIPRRTPWDGR